MQQNKYLKSDPSEQGDKVKLEDIKHGLNLLNLLRQAQKELNNETIVLCVRSSKNGTLKRLLSPPVEDLIDSELSSFGNDLVEKAISEVLEEMEVNGITLSDELREQVLPEVRI